MSEIRELINLLPVPFNFIVIIVAIVFFSGIVTTIAKQIRKFGESRLELDFKRELLDRGMSIDEVERLVRARGAERIVDQE